MTNKPMLSVERELRALAEKACGTAKDSPEYRRFLEAVNPTIVLDLTAEPAAQHQGEPVAYQIRRRTDREDSAWTKWQECSEMERAMHSHEVGKYNRFGIMREIRALYAEQPAPVAVVMPERDALRDLIAGAIGGDTYDCTRVWSAWGVGTMSEDDFVPVVEQDERLYEIADSLLAEVAKLNGVKP